MYGLEHTKPLFNEHKKSCTIITHWRNYLKLLRGGGGGGGAGVHLDFFVKPDLEMAVDQKTRARDQTFEEVPDCWCPRDSRAHIWSIFGSILPNHLRWGISAN